MEKKGTHLSRRIAAIRQPGVVVHLHNDLIVWSHPG